MTQIFWDWASGASQTAEQPAGPVMLLAAAEESGAPLSVALGPGEHRLWYEWVQAASLCYFTPSRVATGPRTDGSRMNSSIRSTLRRAM
jgi:hypothetical protein